MADRYEPQIVVTGWASPPANQTWFRLPNPQFSAKSRAGFLLYFFPNMFRWRGLVRGAAAVNPHFAGLEILPLVLLRKLRFSPRLVISVHGADVTEAERSTGIARSLYAWMYAQADLVIACSDALANKVKQICPKAKLATVWNGVSGPPAISEERPMASPYLISVAAFVRKKGHDVLLNAFRQVASRLPDLYLVLLGGDGPEREHVTSLIALLGLGNRVRIQVNVPHDQIWNWVQHAECFVLASRDEPFGIAVLEAGMVRTPIVATRVGGIPEFLVDRLHGLLCEPEKPEALANSILQVLDHSDEARTRAAAFYQQAVGFTWTAAFGKYQTLLRLN